MIRKYDRVIITEDNARLIGQGLEAAGLAGRRAVIVGVNAKQTAEIDLWRGLRKDLPATRRVGRLVTLLDNRGASFWTFRENVRLDPDPDCVCVYDFEEPIFYCGKIIGARCRECGRLRMKESLR